MTIVHVEGFGHRGAATGMALDYTLGGGGTLTETTMTARRATCFAASCPDVSIKKLIALSGAQVVTGVAVQWTSGAADLIQVLDANGTTVHVTLHVDSAGLLKAYRGDSATGTLLGSASGGTELVSGTPYYLTLQVTVDNAAGAVVARFDGFAAINLASQDTQNGGTASVGGVVLYGPSGGCLFADWYIMDPLVSPDTTWLREARIDCYLPYADQQWTDWTPSTGSHGYAVIDETTPNSDTDYLSTSVAGRRHMFRFGPMSHSPVSVEAVRIIATARKDDTGDRSLKIGFYSEATTDFSYLGTVMDDAQALTTSYDVYDWMDVADTDVEFSTADIFNASAFGVEVA